METRDQKYAKAAFPKVESQKGENHEKGYRTVALNFPVMILQSGLTQSIGFLRAKGKEEHTAYLADFVAILKETKTLPPNTTNEPDTLFYHNQIISCDLATYQLYTRKALEAAAWMKRYTQSLLKGE